MGNAFLIQLATPGYENVTVNHQYYNDSWPRRRKDRAQGQVEPGDTIFFYCTGAIPQWGKSLAFWADVKSITPDKITISIGEINRLRAPLARDRILGLVASGELEDAFRSCGAQGFNITQLQPGSAAKLHELADSGEGPPPPVGSPLEDLVETKLEDYIA